MVGFMVQLNLWNYDQVPNLRPCEYFSQNSVVTNHSDQEPIPVRKASFNIQIVNQNDPNVGLQLNMQNWKTRKVKPMEDFLRDGLVVL